MNVKQRYLILILILFIGSIRTSYAADFYPELGLDPFYSSLNPAYIDKDDDQKDESVLDIIKTKKKTKNYNEEIEEENIEKSDASDEDTLDDNSTKNVNFFKKFFNREKYEESEIIDESDNEDTFVTKKKNRGAELVKELEKEEKEKQKALNENNGEKFSLKTLWPFSKKNEKNKPASDIPKDPELEITADNMEYFQDRYEVEAIGNARVEFKKQDIVLSASKIIFNYDRNILTANDNVVLLSKGTITEGDFIRLDLSKPEGVIEKPVTKTEDVVLRAKEALIYSNRIEEYDGVAKILKDERLHLGSASFAGYVNQTVSQDANFRDKRNTQDPGVYSLKAKTIYIDAKEDHEVITIKNADLYYKNRKLASIPSTKIVSNKSRTNVETNLPEFGSMSLLGMHLGPAVVLNVPGGSTLKLAPIVTYSKDKLGVGGIARFRSENNMTEAAYGTSRDEFLLRGKHKLAPGLTFNYSRLTSQSEWFLGYRKPKYSASLNYKRNDYIKDLGLHFSQMYLAGAVVDDKAGYDFGNTEGRFRWMTQSYKPLYSYANEEGNIAFNTGIVAQTAATVYTTGDVTGLFRIGPAVNTKVGPWKQSLMYYQTAIAGDMPFDFDRYRYGRSNVVLIESLKVCKYLSLGYLASIAMNREVSSDDLFQENRFLVTVGPDYAKVTIGYDAFRRNTMFLFSMLVGTKDTDIEFKRSVIKNPEKFGKEKPKKKEKKKNYKKYLKEDAT